MEFISDAINIIVKPFQLIFDFISLISEFISSIMTILYSLLDLFNNILNILPSSLYFVLVSYISIYVFVIIFRLVKGII